MTKQIQLTQGQVATVCDCHAHLVINDKWQALWSPQTHSFYAARTKRRLGRKTTIRMHRVIANTPAGVFTDHVDGDTLNNQCSNLRDATNAQNLQNRGKQQNNTSGYKGVSWHKGHGAFGATIGDDNNLRHLGYFATAEDAARAYDKAARELHGEFAITNF